MHLLVYTGQVSWRFNDNFFSRAGVLYNIKIGGEVKRYISESLL